MPKTYELSILAVRDGSYLHRGLRLNAPCFSWLDGIVEPNCNLLHPHIRREKIGNRSNTLTPNTIEWVAHGARIRVLQIS